MIDKIEIIDMDISGRGIGKANGKAVFIPGAVTGDTVTYESLSSKKRYDIGKLIDVVSSSPQRVVPSCESYGICGGCSFLHVSRELELEIKRKAVEASFRRSGIKGVTAEKIISGNNKKYRNKAVFHLNNSGKYGFYSAESTECTECKNCLLVPDVFKEIIGFSEKYFTEDHPKNIMLRHGNGKTMIAVQTDRFGKYAAFLDAVCANFRNTVSFYECIGYPTDHKAQYKLHKGEAFVQTDFAGIKLNISPASFFQVNTEIAELVCHEIADSINADHGDAVLDLYCGIGTIGLTVAKRYPDVKVIGVEINESAVSDARENCKISGLDNAEFICSDAGHVDLSSSKPKAVIVDPPRFGLTDSMIDSLLKIAPDTIIYMSCNPSSLAGNTLKLLKDYTVSRCIAADMFPGCPHVEALVVFTKLQNLEE